MAFSTAAFVHAALAEDSRQRALVLEAGQQEQLAGEMNWSPRCCASLSVTFSSRVEVVRDMHFAGRAFHLGQAVERLRPSALRSCGDVARRP